jgi:putative peptidoglycan lipid II flippase
VKTGMRRVALLMGPRVLGLIFVQLHFWINTVLASGLGHGALSALNYAWLLMLLPQGILAQGIATVVFPTLAAPNGRRRRQGLPNHLRTRAARRGLSGGPLRHAAARAAPSDDQPSARTPAPSTPKVCCWSPTGLQFYIVGLLFHAILEIIVAVLHAAKIPGPRPGRRPGHERQHRTRFCW